jgi:hypothetical protein
LVECSTKFIADNVYLNFERCSRGSAGQTACLDGQPRSFYS